ncbi:MAG: GNAT family N-acetyltransferase [Bacteroidota bacterium]|nr:GNAT family N-acetyltransferase [Bacteroidota bacterium]
MISEQDIHYLRRQEIDADKWDRCIGQAANALIYARSFYLDHMAPEKWDALVLDDYRVVMPIPWNRKWGIRYACQPPFTQQLGIFAAGEIAPSLVGACLSRLAEHFRFAELFLNYLNPYPSLPSHTNYILDLNMPYAQLAGGYKKDLVRNLKEAASSSFAYIRDFELSTALSMYRERYGPRTPHVKEESWRRFSTLCSFLRERGQCILRAVRDRKGKVLATALFLVGDGRMHLLQSTNLPEGRHTGANHFLLDRVIAEFAGQPLLLDFEGSDLPGIAHFYANFGSRDEPYFFYRLNRLPLPLRRLK